MRTAGKVSTRQKRIEIKTGGSTGHIRDRNQLFRLNCIPVGEHYNTETWWTNKLRLVLTQKARLGGYKHA